MLNELKKGINFVIGLPAAGKTTFVKKLNTKGYSIYHTDDYKHYGWNEAIKEITKDIVSDDNPNKVIEGVLAFRLLRYGCSTRQVVPDHIILVECNVRVRIERYADDPEREGKDATKMDKRLISDWEEYVEEFHNSKRTTITKYDTSRGNEQLS